MEFISENKILTRDGTIELIEDKYIMFRLHDHITSLKFERMSDIIEAFHHFCNENKRPLLMVANSIDKLGKKEEELIRESTDLYFTSQALVTSNRFTVMVLNLALTIKSTSVPTKIFSNEDDAVEWIQQFM